MPGHQVGAFLWGPHLPSPGLQTFACMPPSLPRPPFPLSPLPETSRSPSYTSASTPSGCISPGTTPRASCPSPILCSPSLLRDLSLPELHQCLNSKWVHFSGDHTSRLLALHFARLLGLQKQRGEGEDGEEGGDAADGPFGGGGGGEGAGGAGGEGGEGGEGLAEGGGEGGEAVRGPGVAEGVEEEGDGEGGGVGAGGGGGGGGGGGSRGLGEVSADEMGEVVRRRRLALSVEAPQDSLVGNGGGGGGGGSRGRGEVSADDEGEVARRRRRQSLSVEMDQRSLVGRGEKEGSEGALEEWGGLVSSSSNVSSSSRRRLAAATELGGSGKGGGGPRVTYLFRGKMARQRHPEPGKQEQRDLNDQFLLNMTTKAGGRPDFIVMGVGVHEVMGWGKRPPPDLDFDAFREDTEKLLDLLRRTYRGGKVVWWKANYIWPGALLMEDYFQMRQFHELYQAHAYRRFQEAGHTVADFYQTTEHRPELVVSQDGTRYSAQVIALHAKIITNILCNRQ
ncbi:unnamed protein product [Closterium sp. Yama58-4]|nr:unnamed protein product [Closterium sp. Yama58-4]